jgi:hypothetical protein
MCTDVRVHEVRTQLNSREIRCQNEMNDVKIAQWRRSRRRDERGTSTRDLVLLKGKKVRKAGRGHLDSTIPSYPVLSKAMSIDQVASKGPHDHHGLPGPHEEGTWYVHNVRVGEVDQCRPSSVALRVGHVCCFPQRS